MIDLTEQQRALHVPFTRLHDCQWPYPDVVDVHAVFPNPDADPERAENYAFALTDEYVAATLKTGAQIIYRLGESIEHGTVKRYVHPPRDPQKWAAICRGIIRHYNNGWANGFHYGIQYWEIWNEPENRPAMWTGNDAQYFELYRVASREIRREFPQLKIGGPAVGYSGKFTNGHFEASPFLRVFLERCRRDRLPFDFFSWHCYTADPNELVERARAIRTLIDSYGFANTEIHLTEWNYLPGNSWDGAMKSAKPDARQRYYEEMSGPRGAAFIAQSLIELEDAPIDVCALFHGELGAFGLFNEYGVPTANYYAMRAFGEVAALKTRSSAKCAIKGINAIASIGENQTAAALLTNFDSSKTNATLKIHLARPSSFESWHLTNSVWQKFDAGNIRETQATLRIPFTPPAVCLLKFSPLN
jgi:hypothetical protein